jgi:hypothetical protein
MQYVYLLKCDGFFKIGIANDVVGRVASLQTGNPHQIELIVSYGFSNAMVVERSLHQKFEGLRHRNEWFELSAKDMDEFCNICQLLGGELLVKGETISESDVADAEEIQEAIDNPGPSDVNIFDFNLMFAAGWNMEAFGNGRENGKNKYWGWRKRKAEDKGYVYGGLISELPYSIEEMRRVYGKK